MSSGHAAATIAVVIIGYNLKLLDENVLNGTVLLILISCVGSSLISERAGRQIAIDDEKKIPEGSVKEERILVPISNLENVDRLIDLSLCITKAKSSQPVYPLFVLSNKRVAEEKIEQYRTKMVRALKDSGIEKSKDPIFRVDMNVGNGILRVITELQITDVIVGWNGMATFGKSFGPILDRVVSATNVQVMICRILYPLNTTKRMVVAIPENAERESGFKSLIDTLVQLSRNAGASIVIFSTERTYKKVSDLMLNADKSQQVSFHPFNRWTDLLTIYKSVEQYDVFIAVQARSYTVSYNKNMQKVPKLLTRYFKDSSVIIMYPNQA